MSGKGSSDEGDRTVFRPSPLANLRQANTPPGHGSEPPFDGPPPSPPWSEPTAPGRVLGQQTEAAQGSGSFPPDFSGQQGRSSRTSQPLNDEDIPVPAVPTETRRALVSEAAPILALAASVRSGRARIAMPEFHRQASQAIAAYDRTMTARYSEEVRMRARYALCATVDDIAQNLPNIGQDGAEWARRSLVVQFFRENIGGERFWQLVENLLQRPVENAELIELYGDCLAAGFEGRFRVIPDGRMRLQQIMASLYAALDHPRHQSILELAPQWKGADAPLVRIGAWNRVALAAAAAAAGLLVIYVILRLMLMAAGADGWKLVKGLTPGEPLRLSRIGAEPPPAKESGQLSRLRQFLAPEIRQRLVKVEEDGSTVRVRTIVGQLFQSGSDQLEPGRLQLFERIGRAVEGEPGQVTIEGHSDSDQIAADLSFPDNLALSKARAETVSKIIADVISNPGRISVEGFGDSRALASNRTPEGKALNRRVEIVIPRQS